MKDGDDGTQGIQTLVNEIVTVTDVETEVPQYGRQNDHTRLYKKVQMVLSHIRRNFKRVNACTYLCA